SSPVYQDGQIVSASLLPSYNDIQTIISDWTDSITLVKNTIEIVAGSFPANPTIRVDINDFDNMPEFISLDLIGSEPYDDGGPIGPMADNLYFNPQEGSGANLAS